MTEDFAGKINNLKASIQTLWQRIADNDFEVAGRKLFNSRNVVTARAEHDNDYDHNYADDLPLTVVHEDGPGVKFYTTENSPMAIGAEKVEMGGIDKFGDEDDTVDPDEKSELSDLSDRFYSPGLNMTKH